MRCLSQQRKQQPPDDHKKSSMPFICQGKKESKQKEAENGKPEWNKSNICQVIKKVLVVVVIVVVVVNQTEPTRFLVNHAEL